MAIVIVLGDGWNKAMRCIIGMLSIVLVQEGKSTKMNSMESQ